MNGSIVVQQKDFFNFRGILMIALITFTNGRPDMHLSPGYFYVNF